MPDFMHGMAKGIKVNTHLITDNVKDVAVGVKTNLQGNLKDVKATEMKLSSNKMQLGSNNVGTSSNNKGVTVIFEKIAEKFIIREDADIDKIAQALVKKIHEASLTTA
ncbi:MAG: hypothetical protein Q8936_18915 [Bacillota bacterium]|nr:hypothetical protein [Bacillota bacterium]